jgi:hypothetical protein
VRARVLAVDTTSEDGVVVCWLWDGTDVAPLPENATCPPAIHQGQPIREPERSKRRRRADEEAAADDAATTTTGGGPVPRPVPLRSYPGVQVMSAPTVLSADEPGGDVVMERPLLMAASSASSAHAAASSAAAAAARMLTSPRFPPVGSAVPLIILPVMSGSRVHGGGGGQAQQQQQRGGASASASTSAAAPAAPGAPVPRLDASSLPAPGAWVKLRHLALQVAPGGELQLLYGTPSKMSIVPAPGSAGDGAAPHLELRLAERLAAAARAAAAPRAPAPRGGAVVAALAAEEVEKAVQRAQEIEAAVREHAGAVAEAVKGLLVGGGGEEDEDGGGENAPAAAASRRRQQQQQQQQQKAGSSTTRTTTPTTPKPIPLITLRQLLSARQRLRACRDAAALAARDEADGYEPRRAYFTRAVRLVVRLASLQPTDLVQWARPVPGNQHQQQKWVLCARAALADGTVLASGAVEAFVAPETSEALLGVDAGPLDGRDARSRDRLARLAASVARLQAVGPAPKVEGRTTGAGAAGGAEEADDDGMLLLVEPTAWVEALVVPRVCVPSQEAEDGSFWHTDHLLTGAHLLSEEEVEEARRRGGTTADAASAALSATVRDAVASAQLEAARRRAGGGGSSPAAGGGALRALPAVQEEGLEVEEQGEDGGGRGKRRRR